MQENDDRSRSTSIQHHYLYAPQNIIFLNDVQLKKKMHGIPSPKGARFARSKNSFLNSRIKIKKDSQTNTRTDVRALSARKQGARPLFIFLRPSFPPRWLPGARCSPWCSHPSSCCPRAVAPCQSRPSPVRRVARSFFRLHSFQVPLFTPP